MTVGGTVVIGQHGRVLVLTLSGPPSHNSLSSVMAADLAAACAEIGDARAVVLASAGPVFCAGADLKERNGFTDQDYLDQRGVFRAAFDALRGIAVPTIAAVHGYALGGGFELALCCDLIVADDTAVFGLPEVTRGIVPGGGGTQLIARRAGYAVAADILFTGRRLGADEAERLGLVNRRAAAGQDRTVAMELAEAIAANSPVAVAHAKRALRAGLGRELGEALDIEGEAWQAAILSADRAEGVRAFVDKRQPDWPGR